MTRPDGRRFVLTVAFDSARHIDAAMDGVRVPKNWTVAVLDRQGRIAGRRPQPEYVGRIATEDARLIALTGKPERGIAYTITGVKALLFSQPIEGTG